MREFFRKYWVVVPVLASMATQCGETPRGVIPTSTVSIDLVLTSVAEDVPTDAAGLAALAACLQRMDNRNSVRASWRGNNEVRLDETSPGSNVWTARFTDVPVGFTNTMTVHDRNECVRNPAGDGHVVMGVTVNGTVVDRVIGNNVLFFEVGADGSVQLPALMPAQ